MGSRCHNKSSTLRQQQQQLADILVQVPPTTVLLAVVWRVVVAVPLGYINVFLVLYFLFSRHSAASFSPTT